MEFQSVLGRDRTGRVNWVLGRVGGLMGVRLPQATFLPPPLFMKQIIFVERIYNQFLLELLDFKTYNCIDNNLFFSLVSYSYHHTPL